MAVRQKRPEPTLEEVDGLLEHVKSALEKWQKMPANHTALADYPELTEVVSQLVSWAPEFLQGQSLGIGPDLTRQILQRKGNMKRGALYDVLHNLQEILEIQKRQLEYRAPLDRPLVFPAEGWASIPTGDIKLKITAVASIIDEILEETKRSNTLEQDRVLTDIERVQLIVILETALALLRGQLVEKGLLKKASSILKKGAESAAEKGVQQAVGKLMEAGATRISELVSALSN
jgi:hypothetical protein